MKLIKIISILFILILFINARSLNVNQSAKNLDTYQGSTSVLFGGGVYLPFYSPYTPGLFNNFGLHQRLSINKFIEFQIFNQFNYYLNFFAINIPNSFNYLDFIFKFNILNHNNNFHFSLLLFNGFYGGYSSYNGGHYGPNLGIHFLFNNNIKNKLFIYYGVSFQYKKNFNLIYNMYTFKLYNIKLNFLEYNIEDFDIGTYIGFEGINEKNIIRHEINFSISFDNKGIYTLSPVDGFMLPVMTFSYTFSFSRKYFIINKLQSSKQQLEGVSNRRVNLEIENF